MAGFVFVETGLLLTKEAYSQAQTYMTDIGPQYGKLSVSLVVVVAEMDSKVK